MPISGYTTVKVFSASRASERSALGEKITTWLAEHPDLEVVSKSVTQSSDTAYHAITIVVFLRERAGGRRST